MEWNEYLLKTLADANRKLGQVKGDPSYTAYAEILDREVSKRTVISEAEEIIKEK